MYYYKEENAYGDYVKDGARFAVTEASVVVCPGKRTPEQCGWVQYPDLQAAVEAWGLEECTKYEVQCTNQEECAPDGADSNP